VVDKHQNNYLGDVYAQNNKQRLKKAQSEGKLNNNFD